MNDTQITTIIASVLQGGGIIIFIVYYIRGLQKRISGLERTIQAQDMTLSVMDKHIAETEKVGSIYKNLMRDLPHDLDNYRAVISKTKDDVILELQNMNKEKDDEILKLRDAEKELERLPLVEVEKRQSVRAIIFLNKEKYHEFGSFIESIESNQEKALAHILKANSIENLVKSMGGSLEVVSGLDTDLDRFKELIKTPDDLMKSNLTSIHSGISGTFAVYVDQHIVMDSKKYAVIENSFTRLRKFIQE